MKAKLIDELSRIVHPAVVVIHTPTGNGTGFFVSEDLVVTAGHVIKNNTLPRTALNIYPAFGAEKLKLTAHGDSGPVSIDVVEVIEDHRNGADPTSGAGEDWPDIAVLRIDPKRFNVRRPIRLTGGTPPNIGEKLSVYGYRSESSAGRSLLFEFAGWTAPQVRMELKDDLAEPGFSGSPIFLPRTALAIGVLTDTRSESYPLGGFATPWSALPGGSVLERLLRDGVGKNGRPAKVVLPNKHRKHVDYRKSVELANSSGTESTSWIKGLTIYKNATVIVTLTDINGEPPTKRIISKSGLMRSQLFFWDITSRQIFDVEHRGVVAQIIFDSSRVRIPAAAAAGRMDIKGNDNHDGIQAPYTASDEFHVEVVGETEFVLRSIRGNVEKVLSCILLKN